MTKTQRPPRPWTRDRAGDAGVDVAAAADFLRSQCASLTGALRAPSSVEELASVLDRHDASHAQWVDLIAAVERCRGQERAARLATVYTSYGRVVGVLECQLGKLAPDAATTELHGILAAYLQRITEGAVGELTGLGAGVGAAL